MIVGVCHIDLFIPEAYSLKDKRSVVKSVIERLRHRFNLSVAEVGALDQLQHAEIAVAVVGNDTAVLHSLLMKTIHFVEIQGRAELIGTEIEWR